MKPVKCYIYTRVSTLIQVDGFSLEAQKNKLMKYAELHDMVIAGEYSDKGKSGKSVAGRPEFTQMLKDIEEGKDGVSYVLVYKLSRFGRNAADVLTSLQHIQDYGVNLICVEEGIDSSKGTGKLIITILSSVAEIERENILEQTMAGRQQKAREGKWNGGFAPYGYKLVDGKLEIAEDEAEVIRLIFDKFIHTNMGIRGISSYLNQLGYKKKLRQNNTVEVFSPHFITRILDNPVYCGKIAFGRRKTEKAPGKQRESHIVYQKDFPIYDGIHQALITEEDWNLVQQKRKKTGVKPSKKHNLDHEHLLTGILRCPICGSGMYGNVSRKKRPDGTYYKEYFTYQCKHRKLVDGQLCTYRNQWKQSDLNDAVAEIIKKLVQNPKFEEAICKKINTSIDTSELEAEIEALRKQQRQCEGAKNKLGQQMDNLDILTPSYEKKYADMQRRQDDLYEEIENIEDKIAETKDRIDAIISEKITGDNIYKYLLCFEQFYDKFSDIEKKEFLQSFVERVEIFEDKLPSGRLLKKIQFRFPVFYDDKEVIGLRWDNDLTVETVCLLKR